MTMMTGWFVFAYEIVLNRKRSFICNLFHELKNKTEFSTGFIITATAIVWNPLKYVARAKRKNFGPNLFLSAYKIYKEAKTKTTENLFEFSAIEPF